MLSLIICSRTPKISKELEKNIAETIGCEYELVVIDNSRNKYSIFSAYNEGVRQAKGNILCFMHDDILYKTQDWGKKVEEALKDESIGVAGVIGSYVMTKDYGYWDMMQPYVTGRVPCGIDGKYINDCDYFFDKNSLNEVVAVDGMWFCSRKDLFAKVSFDEQTFGGFHYYDMDICMQSLIAGYKNIVIRECDIWHNCHPQYNYSFLQSMMKFCNKWQQELPIFRGEAVNMDDKSYRRLYDSTSRYYGLLWKFMFYKNDIENSLSYKLGNAIAEPYRKLMRLIRKNKE